MMNKKRCGGEARGWAASGTQVDVTRQREGALRSARLRVRLLEAGRKAPKLMASGRKEKRLGCPSCNGLK